MCKKTDTVKKIYNIFNIIEEDKILYIKSFTAYSFLNLMRSEITYIIRNSDYYCVIVIWYYLNVGIPSTLVF